MGRVLIASGWTAIVASVAVAVWALFAGFGPQGSWGGGFTLDSVWVRILIAVVLLVAALLSIRLGRRIGHLTPSTFLSSTEEKQVVAAIRAFENRTSGEIRVHLSRRCKKDILETAAGVFGELGMTATADRNGVLFFVDIDDHRFAVLGDQGINDTVPEGFWDAIVEEVRAHFRRGAFADGLVRGIHMAGEALAEHFPVQGDDVNELPDDISKET